MVFYGTFWVQGSTRRIGPGSGRGVLSPRRGLEVSGRCLEPGTEDLPRDGTQNFWGRGCVVGGALLGTGQLGMSQGRGSGPEFSLRPGSSLGACPKSRWGGVPKGGFP